MNSEYINCDNISYLDIHDTIVENIKILSMKYNIPIIFLGFTSVSSSKIGTAIELVWPSGFSATVIIFF